MLVLIRHAYCGPCPLAIAGLGFFAFWATPLAVGGAAESVFPCASAAGFALGFAALVVGGEAAFVFALAFFTVVLW
jgi:hypothetical protein